MGNEELISDDADEDFNLERNFELGTRKPCTQLFSSPGVGITFFFELQEKSPFITAHFIYQHSLWTINCIKMPATWKFTYSSMPIWAVILCCASWIIPHTNSFRSSSSSITSTSTSIPNVRSTCLWSIFDDDKEQPKDGMDLQSFNPLNYQASNNKNPYINQISMRKTRMQEMTGELLNAVGDESMTNEILNRFKKFLLEPLDVQDAVLEPDSIYIPQMSR